MLFLRMVPEGLTQLLVEVERFIAVILALMELPDMREKRLQCILCNPQQIAFPGN
jgi:hypothetical protein